MVLLQRALLFFCLYGRLAQAFTTRTGRTPHNNNEAIRSGQRPPSALASSSSEDSTINKVVVVPGGVTLKIAFDAQGGVADLSSEKSERFTCGESLDMVHRLRRVSDAVLVGRSTVEIDDCTLTVRRVPMLGSDDGTGTKRPQPTRVIIDPKLDLPLDRFKIFGDGLATIVVHAAVEDDDGDGAGFVKTTREGYPDVTFLGLRPVPDEDGKLRLDTRQLCGVLAEEFGIHHVMVEGGPNTALRFLKDGTVDRAILVYAPISFKDPLLSDISTNVLDRAGLEKVGSYALGVDSVECYSRADSSWPHDPVSSWP